MVLNSLEALNNFFLGTNVARLLTEQECKELTRMVNFILRRIEEIRLAHLYQCH